MICGLLFAALLAVRLGYLQRNETGPALVSTAKGSEAWMAILQDGRKVGYAHRSLEPRGNGYRLAEFARMRINTMGLSQDIQVRTEGRLHPDLSLASFTFELQSSMFDFRAQGEVKGKTLEIVVGKDRMEVPLKEKVYLTAAVLEGAWGSGLKPNQSKTFFVFDPATMGQRPVRITMVGSEVLDIMGRRQTTRKLAVDFMGASQTAWVGEDGSVVQEEGFLGIRIKRVGKEEAMSGGLPAAGRDLTEVVSVPANVVIEQPEKMALLRLRMTGVNDSLALNGGRQSFTQGILTVKREDTRNLPRGKPSHEKEFLQSTLLIQADDAQMKAKVTEIVSPADPPLTKAEKLVTWVHRNIQKRPVLSVPNALETLRNRVGDCNEHAVLLAALARAAGIPAQVEAGLVYMRGRFYFHAWNVLYLGRWVTADSVLGQMPADVTHIRLVRGESDEQMNLMGVLGKLAVEILETSQRSSRNDRTEESDQTIRRASGR